MFVPLVHYVRRNPNYQQYQQPGMGLVSPTSMPKNGNYVLRQTSALPMSSMQRHSSTGSTHFLVNEWGEIVGRTGPVVTHTSLDGLAPGGGRNDFPPPIFSERKAMPVKVIPVKLALLTSCS